MRRNQKKPEETRRNEKKREKKQGERKRKKNDQANGYSGHIHILLQCTVGFQHPHI